MTGGWLRYLVLTAVTVALYVASFTFAGYWSGFFAVPSWTAGAVWLIVTIEAGNDRLSRWGWHWILDRHPFRRADSRALILADREEHGEQHGARGLWWGRMSPGPGGGDRRFVQVLFLIVVKERRP